ncbi:tubulin-folding cofactor B [Pyrgilauda ruficollis]|uniref:tubulin-folding cofactor B n=1 Tax=Pyrgilauda ruficollis TaxID=221976 RepID=UPI001B8801DE|nr:tubulin-folding cofactor B [Pyrgilauda ruficollis]
MNGGGTGPGPVWLAVSSSLNAFRACKRFSPSLTIAELKCKLELVVGSPASCMDLELFGAEDEPLGTLDCDEALLGSYPVTDGCRVHVTDRSGARAGQFEDVSQVAKYEMAESDYDKRTGGLGDIGDIGGVGDIGGSGDIGRVGDIKGAGDLSQVAKYEMAESDYDKRTGGLGDIADVGESPCTPGAAGTRTGTENESLHAWGCWDQDWDRERDREWDWDREWEREQDRERDREREREQDQE